MGVKEVKLKDVLDRGTSNLSANKLNDNEGDYPVYGATGLFKNVDFFQQDKEYLAIIKDGAGVGRVYHYPAKSSILGTMQYLFPKDNINIRFAYYYLKSLDFKKYTCGAAIPHIYYKDYCNETLALPSKEEQEKIVSILDKADEIRAKKKLANDKLDEFLKSTFISMFGDPKTNTNNYEFVTINDLTTEISDIGSNGSNAVVASNLVMSDTEDYAYMIRTLNFNDTNIMNNMKYVSKKVYDFFKKSQIFGNEIIMCKIGSAGKFWIMPKLDKPVSLGLNQFFMRFNDKVLREFVYYFLCTGFGQNEIDNRISGAVTKSITKGAIRTIPIYLPPMDEQNKFAKIVEHVEAQKQKNEFVIEQMNNLFNSLSQRAFKGEL